MKKQLLLTVALGAAVSAFAYTAQPKAEEVSAANEQVVATVDNMSNVAQTTVPASLEVANSVVSRDGEGEEPATTCVSYYVRPANAFYPLYLVNYREGMNSISKNDRIYTPIYQPMTWENGSVYRGEKPTSVNMKWTYGYFDAVNDDFATADATSFDLETPAYIYGSGFAAPSLTFNDAAPFQTAEVIFASGYPSANFGEQVGKKGLTYSTWDISNKVATTDLCLEGNEYKVNTLLSYGFGDQYATGNIRTKTAKLNSIALKVDQPIGVYGIAAVYVPMVDFKEGSTGQEVNVTLDIYTINEEGGLGERIAGGTSTAKTAGEAYYFQTVTPIIEQYESYSFESFVNIDQPVYIVVNVTGGEEIYPAFVVCDQKSPLGRHNNAYALLDVYEDETLTTLKGQQLEEVTNAWYTDQTKVHLAYACGWNVSFEGAMTFLTYGGVEDESYFTFEAPADGGKKNFTFDPYYDIYEAGKTTASDEWLFADAQEYDEDNQSQDVTVEVEALPDGVTYREGTITVEILGAKQVITVKQGDPSAAGIEDVVTSAETVATRYFDLQGRELKAAPEAGMFIQKEFKADNSTVVSKVVK